MYKGSQCRQAARVDWGVIGRRCRRNSPSWLTRGRFRVLLVLHRPAMVLGKVIDNCCKLLSCLLVVVFSLCLEHIWLSMAEDMERLYQDLVDNNGDYFSFLLLCHCHCVRCKVVNDEQGCSQRQQLAPRNAGRCHHTSPPLLIGGHHQSRSHGRGWFLSHIAVETAICESQWSM